MTKRHPNPTADLKLVLPRQNSNEVRSYHYFLDVTAPSIGGSFDADFWLREIPRACLADAAIWHAVISLGSVHEYYSNSTHSQVTKYDKNVFALEQFNSAIRCLNTASSPRHANKWRALTVSAIFTCICILEGLFEQAHMHFKAGIGLLQELEDAEREQRSQSLLFTDDLQLQAKSDQAQKSLLSIPVSISSIRSILIGFEMREKALQSEADNENAGILTLLSPGDSFSLWNYYTAPPFSWSCKNLHPEMLLKANRVAESLQSALVLFAQQRFKDLEQVFVNADIDVLRALVLDQEPHIRCFKEIAKVIETIQREFDLRSEKLGKPMPPNKTYLSLQLYHAANRFILLADPDEPDLLKRHKQGPALCAYMVELAEQILNLDKDTQEGKLHPPIMHPLILVAHAGRPQKIRLRAMELLRQLRLEGLWDSLMSASLAEVTMATERAAAREWKSKVAADPTLKAFEGRDYLESKEGSDEEEEVDPLHRVMRVTMRFTGRREAAVVLRTRGDYVSGVSGRRGIMQW